MGILKTVKSLCRTFVLHSLTYRLNKVTLFSIAHFDPSEQESIDDLLKQADKEMYVCKQEQKKAERGAKCEEQDGYSES